MLHWWKWARASSSPRNSGLPRDSLHLSRFLPPAVPPLWLYHLAGSLVGLWLCFLLSSCGRLLPDLLSLRNSVLPAPSTASPFNRCAPSTRALHALHLSIVRRHVSWILAGGRPAHRFPPHASLERGHGSPPPCGVMGPGSQVTSSPRGSLQPPGPVTSAPPLALLPIAVYLLEMGTPPAGYRQLPP